MIVSLDRAEATIHKVATTAEEAARLEREAALLGVAHHPGVVRLTGSRPDALQLSAVAGWCLADIGPRPAAEVAGLGCAVATILADLHDLDIVHGSLQSSHVLLDRDGRPVLCSLGQGRLPGSATGPETEDDVAALIDMLLALLPQDPAEQETAIDVRWALRIPMRHLPTARRLAGRLAAVPGAVLPDPGLGRTPPPAPFAGPPSRSRPGRARVAVIAVAAAGAAAAVMLAGAPHRGIVCPKIDLGCGPVEHRGGVVATDRGRFLLADAIRDPLVIGRWTCGPALPALLRPDRGEVWVWDRWPAGGAAVAARLAGRIEGAQTLRVVAGASGCDHLSVVQRDGVVTTVPANLS